MKLDLCSAKFLLIKNFADDAIATCHLYTAHLFRRGAESGVQASHATACTCPNPSMFKLMSFNVMLPLGNPEFGTIRRFRRQKDNACKKYSCNI